MRSPQAEVVSVSLNDCVKEMLWMSPSTPRLVRICRVRSRQFSQQDCPVGLPSELSAVHGDLTDRRDRGVDFNPCAVPLVLCRGGGR